MGQLRFVIGTSLSFLWFVLQTIRGRVEARLRPNDPNLTYRLASRYAAGFSRALRLKHRIRGTESLSIHPAIFVANHSSNLDVITMCGIFPRRGLVVAKRELEKVPLLGPFLRRAGNIMIDRRDAESAQATMRDAEELLRSREFSVFIFPEGTRNHGEMRPFKKGAFHLAMNAGVPVIPIVCATTPRWIRGREMWKAKDVDVLIDVLEPLSPAAFSSIDEFRDTTEALMRERVGVLTAEVQAIDAERKEMKGIRR